MSSNVVLQEKLLVVLYPAAACGGATKKRETFRLPSILFAAPLPQSREQNGRQAEGEETDICVVRNISFRE